MMAAAVAGDPGAVRVLAADARDGQQMAGAVAAAEQHWGGLDAAVAVAGCPHDFSGQVNIYQL